MTSVAVAASSQIAADAGAEIAAAGGNAVDAAIAANLVQLVTEPGVVSLGAGGFIVVSPPGEAAVMIDGAVEMPGRAASPEQFGQGGIDVMLPYGGGAPTTVGYGSVGTPGMLAAYDLAARRFGSLPWKVLVEPAERHVRAGFPLPKASHQYIANNHDWVFGWNPASLKPLQKDDGSIKDIGDLVHVDGLADTLAAIAEDGVDTFYRGDIARIIANDMAAHGGLLGLADLEAYEARLAPALDVTLDDWHVATVSLPSVGGAVLAAMLLMLRGTTHESWTSHMARQMIDVQARAIGHRRKRLDISDDLDGDVARFLDIAATNPAGLTSPSTVHTSTVDAAGFACAVTASAGYNSGVMTPGAGIWMNNSLGEVELNKRGFHTMAPGTRVSSNMAPTVGRSGEGSVLAIGSPGADRITTAILQTVANIVHLDMPLREAVDHPRLHVEWSADESWCVAYEAGVPVDQLDVPQRCFDHVDMFFGGVSAVRFSPDDGFEMAADIRRTGGTALSET